MTAIPKIAAGEFSSRLLVARKRHGSLSRKSPQANFLPGSWWRVSAITVYLEKYPACLPGSYAVPLLKHGCAELASAQHTIPAKRALQSRKALLSQFSFC
ncbi:MAG: hypothetical protein ACYCYO_06010 [Bacilli bacterium]